MASKAASVQPQTRNKITYQPLQLPTEGFVRLPSVLAVLGISRTNFYNGVKKGKFPKGKLLTSRCRVYPVAEIRALLSPIEDETAA